jgi:hypothetical protein
MSLSRSNKQTYAILSDADGNVVTVSGGGIRMVLNAALPSGSYNIGSVTISAGSAAIGSVTLGAGTAEIGKLAAGTAAIGSVTISAGSAAIGSVTLGAGTNEIGKLAAGSELIGSVTASITGIIPGIGATNLGKAVAGSFAGSETGVASLVVVDNSLDNNLANVTFNVLRVNKFGALHTTGTDNAITKKLMSFSDGILLDGSFTSQLSSTYNDGSCYDVRSARQFTIVGRARNANSDGSVNLTLFACSGPRFGTEDKSATEGDMYNTGLVITCDVCGIFNATYNDMAFPYFTLKNTGTTDACINMTLYSR